MNRPLALGRRFSSAAAVAVARVWLSWVMLLAMAAAAQAQHPTRYSEIQTPGGHVVYHRFDPVTPYATATFGWRSDSEQKGREGLHAMLGSLILNGATRNKPSDYFEYLADLHASTSISVGATGFVAEARAPGKELPEALRLLVKAIRSGTPNAKTFRRTKQNYVNGDRQSSVRPEVQVSRAAAIMLLGEHPLTRGFDPRRFDRATIGDVTTWRRSALNEAPLRIVVSGRIAAEPAAAMVDAAFAGWPKPRNAAVVVPPLVTALPGSISVATTGKQAVIQLIGPTRRIVPGMDVQTAGVASAVLGGGASSRLWQTLREALGATYGGSSSLITLGSEQRAIALTALVDPALVKESIAAMRKTYADWYEHGITAAELAVQRERTLTGFQTAYRDPSAANRLLLPLLIRALPLDLLDNYEKVLADLTVEQVNTFIRERFPKPSDLLLVVGTPDGTTIEAACTVASWQQVATSCRKR